MKLNKILSVAKILAFSAVAVSCSSDFLDTVPTDAVSDENALATTSNAYATLNGIALTMSTQHYYYSQGMCGESYVMIKMESYPSENYNYNYYASGWAPLFNQEFNYRTNSIYDSYGFAYYYNLIGQANTIIARIDNAEGPEADKKFIKASALTFRAYSFEKLARYYCNRWKDMKDGDGQGLILRLDESMDGLGFSTLKETYDQVYKDLDEAIKLYGESGIDRPSGEVWTPNVNVAHAVYARTALAREDYAKALSEAKAARVGYPLMSVKDYQSGFCRPTCEWIFGAYGSVDENNWYWSYGTQYACNGYYAGNTQCGAGGIGRALINRIPNDDARKALFITEDKFPAYDFSYDSKDMDAYFQTYGILGATNDPLWGDVDAYVASMQPDGLDRAYDAGYFYLGGQLKFYVLDQPGVGYLPFIRSSEMVLIEAESNYFLGNESDAIASLVELNATSGRNPGYTCSKSGNDLFNEIKDYRCLELWGEGFEFSDYKRWKLPIQRVSFKDGGNDHQAVAIKIDVADGNNWTWAIPDAETDYNTILKEVKDK